MRLPFADRAEAGRALAERLAPLGLEGAVVLALPRGGVPVGHEVARRLGPGWTSWSRARSAIRRSRSSASGRSPRAATRCSTAGCCGGSA
ncbi:hypothetical protein ACFQHO_04680 [Actinomadura yumaensis]|uniref:hypothetical protein n=1 Tax=Actinomadura yumaensis TaxID=111807 RepID=UPI00360BABC2